MIRNIARRAARAALCGLAFLPLTLGGCHILGDAALRDAQKAAEIPQSTIDGTRRDLKNYERVRTEDSPE